VSMLVCPGFAGKGGGGGVEMASPGISRVLELIATKFQRLHLCLVVVLPTSWDVDVC